MIKKTVYVVSELMDWGDDTTAKVIGTYQTSEAAKKAADERIKEVVDAYAEDDSFPRESLDISDWNYENKDEQIKEIYADEDGGAWVTGLVYQVKINCMTIED